MSYQGVLHVCILHQLYGVRVHVCVHVPKGFLTNFQELLQPLTCEGFKTDDVAEKSNYFHYKPSESSSI